MTTSFVPEQATYHRDLFNRMKSFWAWIVKYKAPGDSIGKIGLDNIFSHIYQQRGHLCDIVGDNYVDDKHGVSTHVGFGWIRFDLTAIGAGRMTLYLTANRCWVRDFGPKKRRLVMDATELGNILRVETVLSTLSGILTRNAYKTQSETVARLAMTDGWTRQATILAYAHACDQAIAYLHRGT